MQAQPANRGQQIHIKKSVNVYISAAAKKIGSTNENAAWGIVTDTALEKTQQQGKVVNNIATIEVALLTALIKVLEENEPHHLTIYTTSKLIADSLHKKLNKWEDNNFHNVGNKEHWKAVLYRLRKRTGETYVRWESREDRSEEMTHAHDIAKKALKEEEAWSEPNLTIEPEFEVSGARLQTLTHRTAYNIIKEKKAAKIGLTYQDEITLRKIKGGLKKVLKCYPTDSTLFLNNKNAPINNKIKDFLWKLLNNRLKTGTYFKYMPEWEDKQYCSCGEIESPEHILMEC
ncbi:uncharacterized protein BXZ73DRAFT_62561, partial [Epithele typhae]|uniref:uncharacterized protein n=1 Tax=Epithele typhae TaxID=378194 RepID=UPI00200824AC